MTELETVRELHTDLVAREEHVEVFLLGFLTDLAPLQPLGEPKQG